MPSEEPRSTCWRCRKPSVLCLCHRIPVVRNRTGIIVLQHRKERNHPLGTARFVRLGLAARRVHVLLGQDGPSDAVSLPAGAALLYPSAEARELRDLPVAERPSNLVLLDATWPLAHQLYRDNPWIRALPHVRLTPSAPSRYRIRAEPRRECLSTLEAVVQALEVVEPELEGLGGLLAAFDHMIERQIDAGGGRGTARPRRPRARPSRAIPAALGQSGDDIVVAYIEPGAREGEVRPEPLRWTAVRWRDGAIFDRDAGDGHVPSSDFSAFCGPGSRILCWHRSSHDYAAAAVGGERALRLKPVWTNLQRTRCVSHVEDIVAELGLPLPRLGVGGRAGRRLAAVSAMARHLRGLAEHDRARTP